MSYSFVTLKQAALLCVLGWLILLPFPTLADEPTRRAQEELRKRNLYFGDINGQANSELIEAFRRYQARKGFTTTGQLDEETANSLKIEIADSRKTTIQPLPDVPVLKSDTAREIAEPDQAKLEAAAQEETTPAPNGIALPAESPSKQDEQVAQRITKFIRDYLRDGETDNVDLQMRYYAFPVQYFDHGQASRNFVAQDTRNYIKRWPQRRYVLLGSVRFDSPDPKGNIEVEFTISFTVSTGGRIANGKTRNLWKIHSEGKNFKILAINEQRLHD